MDGGDGHDVIKDGVDVASVTAGSGDDQVDVTGGGLPDTVACGTGSDTVWTDADDDVAPDCERRLPGPAPTFERVEAALANVAELGTHPTDPKAGLDAPLGTREIGPGVSTLDWGLPEAYRAIATADGTISRVSLRIGPATTASRLVLGIYSDDKGHPGHLLASNERTGVVSDDWNEVVLPAVGLSAGVPYWIAVMGTGGVLQIANHHGGTGDQPSETGRFKVGQDRSQLPAPWRTLTRYPRDGILSAFAS